MNGFSFQWFLLLKKECLVMLRHPISIINPLLFFLMVLVLFPLSMHPDAVFLHQLAPGLIWVAFFLASLLSLENIFRVDYEQGLLEQMYLSPLSLHFYGMAKVVGYWLLTALPLILMTPIFALMLHLSSAELGVLIVSLIIVTPSLSLLGVFCSALTVGLRHSGLLLSLLVLPLATPLIIFGSSCVFIFNEGLSILPLLALLTAILILSILSLPFAIVFALRISLL